MSRDNSAEGRLLSAIRRPVALRAYVALFGLIWCSMLIPVLIGSAFAGSPVSLIPLAMLVFGVTSLWTECRVRVEMHTDHLVVVNRLRKYEIAAEDVADIQIGATGWDPFRECLHVRTRDGRDVELAVTRRMDSIRGRRLRLDALLSELTTWRAQALAERAPENI